MTWGEKFFTGVFFTKKAVQHNASIPPLTGVSATGEEWLAGVVNICERKKKI